MKEILEKLNACYEAKKWAAGKSIEDVINTCDRGDWLLWLAKKLDVDLQNITLAKGLCANTVIHMMKDERSIKSVNAAIAFGKGEITRAELDAAAAAAADAAAYGAAYADADAACAAYAAAAAAADAAAYGAAYADADAACAAYAAAAAAAADAADAARIKNQLLTANICRDILGKILIDKLLIFKSE